jgi:hypothetical protein
MVMKSNVLPVILISGIMLLGFFSLMINPLVKAQMLRCSSYCHGYVQACEDGEADIQHHADFKYHYNANIVDQQYISGYQTGYYFGYYGPYDNCKATDDRSIGCVSTHWDVVTQQPC